MRTCRKYISSLCSDDICEFLHAAFQDRRTDWLTIFAIAQHSPRVSRSDLSTALLAACTAEAPRDAAELFLARGADPNTRDQHFATPLMRSARAGCVEIVECLLKWGAHINVSCRYGMTALHHVVAVVSGDSVKIGRLLIAAGADVEAVNRRNKTPLDIALVRNRPGELLAILGG